MDAVVGPTVRVVAERQQRRHVVVGDEPDVAAVAAVAAVRAAHGDGALTAEADAARAAVTAASVQLALVDELGHFGRLTPSRRTGHLVSSRRRRIDRRRSTIRPRDERADRWASTMAGHETHLGVHDVVVAHADSSAAITARASDARPAGPRGARRTRSSPREPPAAAVPATGRSPSNPTRSGRASSATATGSSTIRRSGGSPARRRCSCSPTITSAPA